MLEATTYFDKGVDPAVLAETLKSFPEPIRPVYFAEDEGKIVKANLLDDEVRFRGFGKTWDRPQLNSRNPSVGPRWAEQFLKQVEGKGAEREGEHV